MPVVQTVPATTDIIAGDLTIWALTVSDRVATHVPRISKRHQHVSIWMRFQQLAVRVPPVRIEFDLRQYLDEHGREHAGMIEHMILQRIEAWLVHVMNQYQAELEDFTDPWGGDLVAAANNDQLDMHTVVIVSRRAFYQGGCHNEWKKMIRHDTIVHNKLELKDPNFPRSIELLEHQRSKNNNCLIGCFVLAVRTYWTGSAGVKNEGGVYKDFIGFEGRGSKKLVDYATHRAHLRSKIPHDGPITVDEAQWVAEYFNVSYTIIDDRGHVLKSCYSLGPVQDGKRFEGVVEICLLDGHYYLVKKNGYLGQNNSPLCPHCDKVLRKDHNCRVFNLDVEIKRSEDRLRALSVARTAREKDDETIKSAIAVLNAGVSHVFIYGLAGTGKSYALTEIIESLENKNVVKSASTAKAAVDMDGGGVTFHSVFGISGDDDDNSVEKCMERLTNDKKARLKQMDILCVEEVSMISNNLFELASSIATRIRLTTEEVREKGKVVGTRVKPFGGIKILATGDHNQLPPVQGEALLFCNAFLLMQEQDGVIQLELLEPRRFQTGWWAELLARMSKRANTPEDIKFLKTRSHSNFEHQLEKAQRSYPKPMIGMFTRKDVKKANEVMHKKEREKVNLNAIDLSRVVKMNGVKIDTIGEALRDRLDNATSRLAKITPGSSIIVTKNKVPPPADLTHHTGEMKKICNGVLGTFHHYDVDEGVAYCTFPTWNELYPIKRMSESFPDCTVSFFPFELAYAVTFHKMQGMTLDCLVAKADLNNLGHPNMAYTIMSRVRDPAGLFLVDFDERILRRTDAAPEVNNYIDGYFSKEKTPFFETLAPEQRYRVKGIDADHQNSWPFKRYPPTREIRERNILFFDFETNTKDGLHTPYLCHMLHVRDGEIVSRYEKCRMCNPSMDVLKEVVNVVKQLITDEVSRCDTLAAEYKAAKKRRKGAKIEEQKEGEEKRENTTPVKLVLCAYNGSGFDFHFILKELKREMEGFQLDATYANNSGSKVLFFRMNADGKKQTLLDTCDPFLLTGQMMSLERCVNAFTDGSMPKTHYPHTMVTEDLFERFSGGVPTNYVIDASGDPLMKGVEGANQFDLHATAHTYCKNDVDILRTLYGCLDKLCHETANCCIGHFHTLPQMTAYVMKEHMRVATASRSGDENMFVTDDNNQTAMNSGRKKKKEAYSEELKTKIYVTTLADDKRMLSSMLGGKSLTRRKFYESSVLESVLKTVPDDESPSSSKPMKIDIKAVTGKTFDEIDDAYAFVDEVGLYAHCQQAFPYPYGQMQTLREGELYNKIATALTTGQTALFDPSAPTYYVCAHVYVVPDPYELEPRVPHKTPTNLPPEMIDGEYDGAFGELRWDNSPRWQHLFTPDLFTLLENNVKFTHVREIFYWSRGQPFLKPWISQCTSQKAELDTKMKEHKRNYDITKDPAHLDKAKECKSKREFYKVMSNAMYGATLKQDKDKSLVWEPNDPISSGKMREKYCNLDYVNFEEVHSGESTQLIALATRRDPDEFTFCTTPRFVGRWVLALSRHIMSRAFSAIQPDSRAGTPESVENQCLYTDTDSVIMKYSAIKNLLDAGLYGTNGGQMCCDFEKSSTAAKVIGMTALAPKTYCVAVLCPDGRYFEKVMTKGIPKAGFTVLHKGITTTQFTYKSFRKLAVEALEAHKKGDLSSLAEVSKAKPVHSVGVRPSNKQRAEGYRTHSVGSGELNRRLYNTLWSKREPFGDWMVPIGWVPRP